MINYIGSKKSLFEYLYQVMKRHVKFTPQTVFGDAFTGTGIVAQSIRDRDECRTISCDTERYSWLIQTAMMNLAYTTSIQNWLNWLNTLPTHTDGWVTRTYSPRGGRMFFTEENALRFDTIRSALESLRLNQQVSENEYWFILASLTVSMDKVANVSCVYGAYLKTFKKSALERLVLRPIHTETERVDHHTIYHSSVMDVEWSKCDIVYLDPPYNQRQYGANYFVLNALIDYDSKAVVYGKTGLIDYYKSPFSQKGSCLRAFGQLLDRLQKVPVIVLSYNNEGIVSREDLETLLVQYGKVVLYIRQYKKFKSQQRVLNDTVDEYVWVIETKFSPGMPIQIVNLLEENETSLEKHLQVD
jgi:adenine-specific DNA-methyltransferase